MPVSREGETSRGGPFEGGRSSSGKEEARTVALENVEAREALKRVEIWINEIKVEWEKEEQG